MIAVEPNQAMRAAAHPHPLIDYRPGTGETTELPDESVGLVTCFQSFHWLNPQVALAEFHRIIRPRGRVALVWNISNQSDRFTREFREAVFEVVGRHPVAETNHSDAPLVQSPLFGRIERREFKHVQPLDLAGLIGRTRSESQVPKDGEAWERLQRSLIKLHERHADARGSVDLQFLTIVSRADRS